MFQCHAGDTPGYSSRSSSFLSGVSFRAKCGSCGCMLCPSHDSERHRNILPPMRNVILSSPNGWSSVTPGNDSACYDIIFSVGGTDLDISDPFKYREDHGGLVSVIGISAGFRDNDCEIQNQTVSASGRIRCSSHELLRRRNLEAGESDQGYRCEAGCNHVCRQ